MLHAPSRVSWCVQALQVGDWYAHKRMDTDIGITISHQSGIGTYSQLTPASTVRALRALSALPPCPVGDRTFCEALEMATIRPVPAEIRTWIAQVRATLDGLGLHKVGAVQL
jgi:hypothetical protein